MSSAASRSGTQQDPLLDRGAVGISERRMARAERGVQGQSDPLLAEWQGVDPDADGQQFYKG